METNWGDTPSVTLNLPRHNNIKFMNDTKKNLPSLRFMRNSKESNYPAYSFVIKEAIQLLNMTLGSVDLFYPGYSIWTQNCRIYFHAEVYEIKI